MPDPRRSEYDSGDRGTADPRFRPEYRGDNYEGLRPKEEDNDDYDDD